MILDDDRLVQRSKMLRESPSRVLRLDRAHVQPNVVVPREVMYGCFVRRYREHLRKRFIVNFVPEKRELIKGKPFEKLKRTLRH